jgi:hypothetical protein
MQASGSYDDGGGGGSYRAGSSGGGGGAVRARKPYTITKAREKWTPEEHLKFIEAIKMFGRSWKKIEGAAAAAAALVGSGVGPSLGRQLWQSGAASRWRAGGGLPPDPSRPWNRGRPVSCTP